MSNTEVEPNLNETKKTIAGTYLCCIESFGALLGTLTSTGDSFRSLQQELGRLQVWAGKSGAHRTGRVSLDHRLRDASRVKRKVLELLNALNEELRAGK
jgi:hypothetical protein